MQLDEKARWNRKYSERPHPSPEPDPFLVSAYSEFLSARPPGRWCYVKIKDKIA